MRGCYVNTKSNFIAKHLMKLGDLFEIETDCPTFKTLSETGWTLYSLLCVWKSHIRKIKNNFRIGFHCLTACFLKVC